MTHSLTAPEDALKEFFRWIMREGPWMGGMPDGGEVQDKAEELGLIVKKIANELNADEWQHIDGVEEIGDTYFVFAPFLRDVNWSEEKARIENQRKTEM